MTINLYDPFWLDSINSIKTIIEKTNHTIEEIKINDDENFSESKVIQIREKLENFVEKAPFDEKIKCAFDKISILSDKTLFYSVKMATSKHCKYILDELANIK